MLFIFFILQIYMAHNMILEGSYIDVFAEFYITRKFFIYNSLSLLIVEKRSHKWEAVTCF